MRHSQDSIQITINSSESRIWANSNDFSICSFYQIFSSTLSSWLSHLLSSPSSSFTLAPSSPSRVSYFTLLARHSSFSATIPPLLHLSSFGVSYYHLLSMSKHCLWFKASRSSPSVVIQSTSSCVNQNLRGCTTQWSLISCVQLTLWSFPDRAFQCSWLWTCA